jgi:hypothetical protein
MQRSFQSSSAPELTASASGAPELTASDSRNFLLRDKPGSKLGSELNEKFIFRNLPMDVKGVIDQKVVDEQTVRFCRRLSSIEPNNRMDPEVFLEKCSDFIKEVQVFIEKMGLGDINPKQQFVFGDTCLEYVERKCLILLNEMFNYKCETHEQLDKLKIQIDMLRNMIIHPFAENRNTENKAMLTEVLHDLDDSKFKIFLNSTERLILRCINTLKSNTDPLVVKDFETRALTLLEECSDILVSILRNERISIKLKKQTMELFTYIMDQMFLIFQQAQQTRVGSEMQYSTYEKYRELKIKYDAIKEYPPPSAQRRGGNSQIQSKNKSKRKNDKNKNSRRKNKKIKKKTLRLRFNN